MPASVGRFSFNQQIKRTGFTELFLAAKNFALQSVWQKTGPTPHECLLAGIRVPIGGDALITAIQATLIEDGTIMDNVTEHHRSPCYPASLQFLNRRSHKVGRGRKDLYLRFHISSDFGQPSLQIVFNARSIVGFHRSPFLALQFRPATADTPSFSSGKITNT